MRQNKPVLEQKVPLEVTELTVSPGGDLAGAWLCMTEDRGPCWAELGFV